MTFRLAVVGICFFAGNFFFVFGVGASEPSSVTKVMGYELKPEESPVAEKADSDSTFKIDYKYFVEKKYNRDFLKQQTLYENYKLSEWGRANNSMLRSSTSNSYLRKTDLQGIVANLAKSYVYKIDFQSAVLDYRDLFFHGFSAMTNNFLVDAFSGNERGDPNFFGKLYHSMAGFMNYNSDFGKFYLDPSLGFGYTGVKLSYHFIYGTISSSWNMDCNKLSLKIRIPLNSSEAASVSKKEPLFNTVSK
jgi:hypothetical protein